MLNVAYAHRVRLMDDEQRQEFDDWLYSSLSRPMSIVEAIERVG